MVACLVLLRIPERKALPREQRRFVYETCVHPLLISLFASGAKCLIVAALLYAGVLLGFMSQSATSLAVIMGACLIPSELVESIIVARNHAPICDFIKEHRSELAQS